MVDRVLLPLLNKTRIEDASPLMSLNHSLWQLLGSYDPDVIVRMKDEEKCPLMSCFQNLAVVITSYLDRCLLTKQVLPIKRVFDFGKKTSFYYAGDLLLISGLEAAENTRKDLLYCLAAATLTLGMPLLDGYTLERT